MHSVLQDLVSTEGALSDTAPKPGSKPLILGLSNHLIELNQHCLDPLVGRAGKAAKARSFPSPTEGRRQAFSNGSEIPLAQAATFSGSGDSHLARKLCWSLHFQNYPVLISNEGLWIFAYFISIPLMDVFSLFH